MLGDSLFTSLDECVIIIQDACYCKFQLKVYTEQRAARSFKNNIGFTTPRLMVSSTINLSRQHTEIITVNFYSFFMCLLYAVSVYLVFKHFYPSHEVQISEYIRDNNELVGGLTVTTILTVAIEILTRIINSAIWSATIDNGSGVFVAVWLPQGCIFFMGTCVNIYYHIKYLIRAPCNDSGETMELRELISDSEGNTETRQCLDFFRRCYDTVVTKFSANINVHVILPLMLTAYGIIYTAFPAFILMVAYPTQVISIIPTAVAFLFATIVFSAIMIKLYKQSVPSPRLQRRRETIMFIVCRFIPFYFAVLFLKSVVVIFLYLLIIGRGSLTTGPLLTILLSILPPLSVSGVSWIAKKMILDG